MVTASKASRPKGFRPHPSFPAPQSGLAGVMLNAGVANTLKLVRGFPPLCPRRTTRDCLSAFEFDAALSATVTAYAFRPRHPNSRPWSPCGTEWIPAHGVVRLASPRIMVASGGFEPPTLGV